MQQISLFANLVEDEPVAVNAWEDILNTHLSEAVFTVLDLETTGLSAKKNAITEVTAIQFKNGQEIGKFSTLIKPHEPIPPEVEVLTGISNEMVQQAPALITVLSDLCQFMGSNPIIVGHNVPFDIGFLQEKVTDCGLHSHIDRFDLARSFCTKALAVKALPGLPSYQGLVVATQCGVYNPNPHRAESDVRMSAGILFALIERLQKEAATLRTVADLLAYQGILEAR